MHHLGRAAMRHIQIYTMIKAVVEQGSIRKASETMAISPSALNRRILAFEDELGVELFERLAVGVRLSSAGEIYYRQFIDHIAALMGAKETVAELSGIRIGEVRVAVSDCLAGGFLPQVVESFRNDHPRVKFRFIPAPHDGFGALLDSGAADLALIAQPQHRAGIGTIAVIDADVVAVVPVNGPTRARALRADDLMDHHLVLPAAGHGFREVLNLYFKHRLLELDAMIETARLLPPHVTGGRASLQFWPVMDLNADHIAAMGGRMAPLYRAPRLRVALCRLEGRNLPLAAQRFVNVLSAALQDWNLNDG